MRTRDDEHHSQLVQELVTRMMKPKGLLIAAGVLVGVYTVANALFLQEGEHPASLFAMRDDVTNPNGLRADELGADGTQGKNLTRIVFQGQQIKKNDRLGAADVETVVEQLPPPSPAVTQPLPVEDSVALNDGTIVQLQQLLSQLGFYDGELDGKPGPMTAAAIVDYKTSAGLQGIELSTDQLITSARNNLLVTAAIPASRPETLEPRRTKTVTYVAPSATPTERPLEQPLPALDPTSKETVMKVQQALRDYAGDHIVVDGVFGSQTSKAIAEFQSVFRMKITGNIDGDLIERMVDVGMIDG